MGSRLKVLTRTAMMENGSWCGRMDVLDGASGAGDSRSCRITHVKIKVGCHNASPVISAS